MVLVSLRGAAGTDPGDLSHRGKFMDDDLIEQHELKMLALAVLAQAMTDLAIRAKRGEGKWTRLDARHFFFSPIQRPSLEYWCDLANVNREMVVRHARTVANQGHL